MCGENIDMESAAECSYEFAEQFYGKAVTSRDYLILSDFYNKALNYKDGRSKYNECQFCAEKISVNEKIYDDALLQLKKAEAYNAAKKWTDAEREYTEAEHQFKKIVGFMDSDEKIKICRQEKNLCNSKKTYFSAKAVLSSASCIEDYKKAAGLFSEILDFNDAKKNYGICLDFIDKLTAEKQLEKILKDKHSAEEADLEQKIKIYRTIVALERDALSEAAKKVILQTKVSLDECLKEKWAVELERDLKDARARCAAAENISDYKVLAQELEKFLKDYEKYVQAAEFSDIFAVCKKRLQEARVNVSYDEAMELMSKAANVTALKKASEMFERLADFKDSQQRKIECQEKIEMLTNKTIYDMAVDSYEKGRKINIFNWRKYK